MSVLKVLLAEDNPGDILLVKEALAQHHITNEMYVVRDGGEALAFIDRMGETGSVPCPDVLLLDLNLPKVDGPEILVEFRKNPQCLHTPVIVISSSDTHKDRQRMDALGVTCYFRKPSDLEEFLQLGALVQRVVEDAERSGQSTRRG
jgi:chemotaxis family two-component system response regulator Rcp1